MAAVPSVVFGGRDVSGPKMFDSSVEIWLVAAVAHALTLLCGNAILLQFSDQIGLVHGARTERPGQKSALQVWCLGFITNRTAISPVTLGEE